MNKITKMKHCCELCHYGTNKKFNYDVHLKSKKHLRKVNTNQHSNIHLRYDSDQVRQNKQELSCKYCNQIFKRMDGLTKHIAKCPNILKENTKLKKDVQQLKEQLNKEKDNNEYYKELLKESVKGGKCNNIIIMVNNHFGEANNLLAPGNEELRVFGLDHPKKASYTFKNDLIEQANTLLLDSDEAGEDKYYYDKLTEVYGSGRDKRNDQINREKCKIALANYISTGIRVLYKTKNPEDQSFWATDVSRYNFIIKNERWKNDKSGEKLKQTLVTTILDDINVRMKKQIQRETKKSLDYSEENKLKLTVLDHRQIIRDIPRASYIIEDIETGALGNLIIKKTAKYFKVDKELLFDLEHLNKKKSVAKKVKTSKKGLRKIKKAIKIEEDDE